MFVILALIAATSGKLPFRLRGQAEVYACQAIQFADKHLAVIPTNLVHGVLRTLKIRRVAAHDSLPQPLRYLCLTDIVIA